MSYDKDKLITQIKKEVSYKFHKLLNIVPFDELHDFVNIYCQNNENLLLWMIRKNHKSTLLFIDLYSNIIESPDNSLLFKLFSNRNQLYFYKFIEKCNMMHIINTKNNLLYKSSKHDYGYLIIRLIDRFGILCKPHQHNINMPNINVTDGMNAFDAWWVTYSSESFEVISKLTISFGILCINPKYNYINNFKLYFQRSGEWQSMYKNSITYFGILFYKYILKSHLYTIKYNSTLNKLILVYGVY
jgi:hypothetical protein